MTPPAPSDPPDPLRPMRAHARLGVRVMAKTFLTGQWLAKESARQCVNAGLTMSAFRLEQDAKFARWSEEVASEDWPKDAPRVTVKIPLDDLAPLGELPVEFVQRFIVPSIVQEARVVQGGLRSWRGDFTS